MYFSRPSGGCGRSPVGRCWRALLGVLCRLRRPPAAVPAGIVARRRAGPRGARGGSGVRTGASGAAVTATYGSHGRRATQPTALARDVHARGRLPWCGAAPTKVRTGLNPFIAGGGRALQLSEPWSQVKVNRACIGIASSTGVMASTRASAQCPFGRCTSRRAQLLRQTRVPIAERLDRATMRPLPVADSSSGLDDLGPAVNEQRRREEPRGALMGLPATLP